MMRDFDKRWAKAERSHRRMRRFIIAMQIVVLVLMAALLIGGIYAVTHISPEDVGGWFGRLASGFEGAK